MATLADLNVEVGMRLDKFDQGISQLESGIGRLGGKLESLGGGLTRLVSVPLSLLGGAAIKASADLGALRKGLATFEGTAEKTEKRLKELVEVAKLPGLGLREAVQADIRLRAVGISADLAQKSMLAFGNAIATVGGGKAELNQVTVQLAQLAAKGKVLAQDLRPIIEAAPAVATALQKLYGTVDSAQISEQLEAQGKSSVEFIQTLVGELSKLPPVSGGLKNAFENLGDSAFQSLSKIGDSIEKTFNLTENLGKLGAFLERTATAFSNLDPTTQKIVVVFGALAIATGPVLFGIGKIVSIIPTLVTGFTTLRASILSVNGALGLAVAALGAYALAQLDALNAQKQANENFATDTIAKAVSEYNLLSDALKQQKYAELTNNLKEYVRQINNAIDRNKVYKDRLAELQSIQGKKTNAELDEARRILRNVEANDQLIERYRLRKEIAEGTLRGIVEGLQKEEQATAAVVKVNSDQVDALKKVGESLRQVEEEFKAFGASYDYVAERAKALESGISTLISAGFNAQSSAVQRLVGELNTLGQAQKDALGGFNKIGFDALSSQEQQLFKRFQAPNLELNVSGAETTANLFARVGESIKQTVSQTQGLVDTLAQRIMDSYKVVVDFGRAASNSLTEFAAFAGETLGQLFTGDFNAGNFFKGLLEIVANFIGQFGKALIAAGIGALSFKKLLVNPPAAIAAGVALVALAGVAASIANRGPSPSGGSSSSSPAIASGIGFDTKQVSSAVRSQSVPSTVSPTGSTAIQVSISGGTLRLVQSGAELLAIIETEQNKQRKTGG